MLVLHYQVYGEERFPKLFFYRKLFVRFAKYQNAKWAHCTKSENTKVPKFCTDIRLFKCDCMSKKKNFENIVSIQSYMYDFVIKFEKVCFLVKKDFQNYFLTKSYSSVSQNIKMRNRLIYKTELNKSLSFQSSFITCIT